MMSEEKVENGDVEIRDVWARNLESEIYVIRNIVGDFPFIAMDTEFPGVVVHDTGAFQELVDANYQYVRANVDRLHLLQLGLTFFNAAGSLPASPDSGRPVVWQFNFREFDVGRDPSSAHSVKFLEKTGMDFKKNQEEGVDAKLFAELFIPSGTVLDDSVYWVAFQSAFDFAYLLKILTCKPLPETREGFFEILQKFFPLLYDIKRVIHLNDNFHGGLNSLATLLGIDRVGIAHHAGSDSFVTAQVFLKLRGHPVVGSMENYVGLVFGLDAETHLAGTVPNRRNMSSSIACFSCCFFPSTLEEYYILMMVLLGFFLWIMVNSCDLFWFHSFGFIFFPSTLQEDASPATC